MQKQRIFSGIKPSGDLHLGNYLGAIKNWVEIYEKYDSIFCVVDLHAITVAQEPKELKEKIIKVAKTYLAAGINPEKAIIFLQSTVPAHSELMWVLNTIAKTGELFKMTQFKEKAGIKGDFNKNFTSIDVGLMNYPILMAADILLYDTAVVPVGEDQIQHVELARDLAKRFNHRFGETFVMPKAKVKKENMRIMGLENPKKKMSKSAQSKFNQIDLLDQPEEIREKIKKAVTDSGSAIEYNDEHPAIRNLINIYTQVSGEDAAEIVRKYQGKGYKEFKEELAEALINFLKPLQAKFSDISDEEIKAVFKKGAEQAGAIAEKKIKEVKEKIGLGG